MITPFVQREYFTVYKWDVHGQLELEQDKPFMLVSVIVEEGTMMAEEGGNGRFVKKAILSLERFKSKELYHIYKQQRGDRKMTYKATVEKWLSYPELDAELKQQLISMQHDEKALEDI